MASTKLLIVCVLCFKFSFGFLNLVHVQRYQRGLVPMRQFLLKQPLKQVSSLPNLLGEEWDNGEGHLSSSLSPVSSVDSNLRKNRHLTYPDRKDEASHYVSAMRKMSMLYNQQRYSELLDLFERILRADSIIKVTPDMYDIVVRSCTQLLKSGQSMLYLKLMLFKYKIIPKEETIMTVLRYCQTHEKWTFALNLFGCLEQAGIQPTLSSMKILLLICAQSNKWELVINIISSFKNVNLVPDLYLFQSLITMCQRQQIQTEDLHQKAYKLLEIMRDKFDIEPSISIYSSIADICAKHGDFVSVLRVIQMMEKDGTISNVAIFSSFIIACKAKKRPDIAYKAFEMMKIRNIEPNLYCFTSFFAVCTHSKNYQLGLKVYEEMIYPKINDDAWLERNRFKPNSIFIGALLIMLEEVKEFEKVIQVCHRVMSKFDMVPTLTLFETLVHSYVKCGLISKALSTIRLMNVNYQIRSSPHIFLKVFTKSRKKCLEQGGKLEHPFIEINKTMETCHSTEKNETSLAEKITNGSYVNTVDENQRKPIKFDKISDEKVENISVPESKEVKMKCYLELFHLWEKESDISMPLKTAIFNRLLYRLGECDQEKLIVELFYNNTDFVLEREALDGDNFDRNMVGMNIVPDLTTYSCVFRTYRKLSEKGLDKNAYLEAVPLCENIIEKEIQKKKVSTSVFQHSENQRYHLSNSSNVKSDKFNRVLKKFQRTEVIDIGAINNLLLCLQFGGHHKMVYEFYEKLRNLQVKHKSLIPIFNMETFQIVLNSLSHIYHDHEKVINYNDKVDNQEFQSVEKVQNNDQLMMVVFSQALTHCRKVRFARTNDVWIEMVVPRMASCFKLVLNAFANQGEWEKALKLLHFMFSQSFLNSNNLQSGIFKSFSKSSNETMVNDVFSQVNDGKEEDKLKDSYWWKSLIEQGSIVEPKQNAEACKIPFTDRAFATCIGEVVLAYENSNLSDAICSERVHIEGKDAKQTNNAARVIKSLEKSFGYKPTRRLYFTLTNLYQKLGNLDMAEKFAQNIEQFVSNWHRNSDDDGTGDADGGSTVDDDNTNNNNNSNDDNADDDYGDFDDDDDDDDGKGIYDDYDDQ